MDAGRIAPGGHQFTGRHGIGGRERANAEFDVVVPQRTLPAMIGILDSTICRR
jgi:hypothetical protein